MSNMLFITLLAIIINGFVSSMRMSRIEDRLKDLEDNHDVGN